MSETYIQSAVEAIVNDDSVEAMNNIKSAIYDELGNNEEFQELQDDIKIYGNVDSGDDE